jgi:hypothetical protein
MASYWSSVDACGRSTASPLTPVPIGQETPVPPIPQ